MKSIAIQPHIHSYIDMNTWLRYIAYPEKPYLKVQYKFLDWKWPPPISELFQKNSFCDLYDVFHFGFDKIITRMTMTLVTSWQNVTKNLAHRGKAEDLHTYADRNSLGSVSISFMWTFHFISYLQYLGEGGRLVDVIGGGVGFWDEGAEMVCVN